MIRSGQKLAFTNQVKEPVNINRRNTPQGAIRAPARFLKSYDPKQRALERKGPPIRAKLDEIIPKEILLGHAVNITRRHMGMKADKLVRQIPVLDYPTKPKREQTRRAPNHLTIAEKKQWKRMKWYKG